MTVDDLSAPLGQQPNKRRRPIRVPIASILAGGLAAFLGLFMLWAVIVDNPFGGEPMVVVPADLRTPTKKVSSNPATPVSREAAATLGGAGGVGQAAAPPRPRGATPAPPGSRTVTIINGNTGAREEVIIPGPGNDAAGAGVGVDPKFVEMTPHGLVPRIALDGVRPSDAFAQPVKPLPGKPDAPRVALIVGGLGVSASTTAEVIAKLPGPVTLAFMPYGSDLTALVARARRANHEVLLQVPMEPFDYPDNDPGPQALLTSLAPEQNIDRLYWLMSRFQGYVGLIDVMGARFTASEEAFGPVLHEAAKRGLIFVDDGANARSIASRIAGANSLPFAKADVVLDAVPTPVEIDRALGRVEMAARERGVAVGIATALPVSIAQIAKWAKTAESRGVLLVPITAAAVKPKQS